MKFIKCQLNLRFSDTTEYRTAVGHEFLVISTYGPGVTDHDSAIIFGVQIQPVTPSLATWKIDSVRERPFVLAH